VLIRTTKYLKPAGISEIEREREYQKDKINELAGISKNKGIIGG
jgi:hypothetical protein